MDASRLRIVQFRETQDVKAFTCGNKDLDDFLTTEEVRRYEEQGFGRTYLVYYEGELVAYFTISNDGLRYEYLRKATGFSMGSEKVVDSLPAVKIGRLAVSKDKQNLGIGRSLITYIAKLAIETGSRTGVRLLILEAKPDSVEFYRKCGFRLTTATHREKKKVNRTMFMDLKPLVHLLPSG